MSNAANENIKKIREAVENNKLVVFVGSGVSMNSGLPSWSGLIAEFAEAIGINTNKELGFDDYLRIAQYYYNERGLKEYYDRILEKFNKRIQPNLIHEKILELNPAHIITTNYDDLIEQSLEHSQLVYDLVCEDIDLPYTPNGRLLIKMHGDIKRKNIVLKEDDYLLYPQKFKLIETFVKSLFVNHVVLFIGYSLQDMDLKMIIKWIKDILGEHFQRAYFLDSDENKKSQVEVNYFNNLGVNIISKFDIEKSFQDSVVSEIENEKGKNIIRCINYIMEFENKTENIIDYFYERLIIFKDLNRLRLKDLVQAIGIDINFSVDSLDYMVLSSNEKINSMELLVMEFIKIDSLGEEKVDENNKTVISLVNKSNYIKKLFLSANIQGIKIVNYENKNLEYKIDSKYKSNELGIINLMKMNSYIEINLYCEQTYKPLKDHKNKYFNELIRAYSNYLTHRYVSAYDILNKLSKEAYKDKQYIVFYICEFNKKQLIRFMDNYSGYGEKAYLEYIDILKSKAKKEIKRSDLREQYFKLPNKERVAVSFLNDVIIDEKYFNDKKIKSDELKEKVGKEVMSLFIGSSYDGAISELKREIYEFWECTHNYLLMIDNYSDIRKLYYNYICAMFSTYSKKKMSLKNEKNLFFPASITNTMPDYIFNDFDLYMTYSYIKYDELIELFKEYEIEELKTSVPSMLFMGKLHNICVSYVNLDYRTELSAIICNMFVIGANLNLTEDDCRGVVEKIVLLIDKSYLNLDVYKSISYFMVKKGSLLNSESMLLIISSFIKKLMNIEYNNNHGGWEIETISNVPLIHNLSIIAEKNNYTIELADELLDNLLYSVRFCILKSYKLSIIIELLIPIHKILSDEKKKQIEELINETLNYEFNFKLYTFSCLNEVIGVNEDFEIKLLNELVLSLEEREKSNMKVTPDPIDTKFNYLIELLLHDKIKNREFLNKLIGNNSLFDFVVNPKEYSYEKFESKWILYFNEKQIEEYAKDGTIKSKIKSKLKNEILNLDIDKPIKEIYFRYFE